MVLSLLRRYLQLYWLKPFDAVNDAANAWALLRFPWAEPILEVGGGDGVFSFILHGGAFSFLDDRYAQADPSIAGDIYDIYRPHTPMRVARSAQLTYHLGLDLKLTHLHKCRETHLYRHLVSCQPEAIPLSGRTYATVFFYLLHGLKDYEMSLRQIRRVIQDGGTLLMIAFNERVRDHFVCHDLAEWFRARDWKRAAGYFAELDGGRYEEIGGMARSLGEWRVLLGKTGFEVQDVYAQVSPLVWWLYDTQTRPLLTPLIRFQRRLGRCGAKRVVKAAAVAICLPLIMLAYLLGARPRPVRLDAHPSEMLFALRARAI